MLEKIYDELVGDKAMQRKGLIERVSALENKRWKEVVASAGVGGVIGGTIVYLLMKLGIIPVIKMLAEL